MSFRKVFNYHNVFEKRNVIIIISFSSNVNKFKKPTRYLRRITEKQFKNVIFEIKIDFSLTKKDEPFFEMI